MKKLVTSLLLVALMALTLAGCGGDDKKTGYPNEDGIAEGSLGDTMHNCFFDFTVKSAYLCKDFDEYTTDEGYLFLVAEITVKNTFGETLPMFDTDFVVEWDDSADYPCYFEDGIGGDVLPAEYELAKDESKSGLLLFAVPEDKKDFTFSYMEVFEDNTTGNTFNVSFTAEQK
ncbi:DUF4352 domain-containing protein [Acetatifactor muris]|uniref:Telomeric repeat-binding factor 2 n=1 Tax=Acetatifactor muris TaxID=879566 RepID=A0A2K4ZEN6_9FIRM|nr:DUF4352 domain-containing protein [Acetatifactor muris]MCR2048533.1 DUF4352 domain-containing protein [Acetatifactor muris]SOY28925.1 Telomeric repeat-binding factor 2 [Acetatifactor muris]